MLFCFLNHNYFCLKDIKLTIGLHLWSEGWGQSNLYYVSKIKTLTFYVLNEIFVAQNILYQTQI